MTFPFPPLPEDSTHFGKRTVPVSEKSTLVKEVFTHVASRYDVMNDVMSMGIHRLWKKRFVRALSPKSYEQGLDVAAGTGDISLLIKQQSPLTPLTLYDMNPAMLEQASMRLLSESVKNVEVVVGNAESLPFPDMYFHFYTVAFGIRNVARIPLALAEAYRCLRPGGRFFCLEFSQVSLPVIKQLYDLYSFHVIPLMGDMIARDRASYEYLVESIRRFPSRKMFAEMITQAGFRHVRYETLSGGVVAIHSGWRL